MRAALIVALMLPSLAWAQDATIYAYGDGNGSCASWLANRTSERIGSEWILGYWTGRNVSADVADGNGMVGSTTDTLGIIAEVKLVCEAEPSKSLLNAADEVYRRMQSDRR
jgi:hypothetical protein